MHSLNGFRCLSIVQLRGYPLRIEFGPKDAAKGVVTTVRRDNGEKGTIQVSDSIAKDVQELLDTIQVQMLETARQKYHDHIKYTSKWDEIVPLLNSKNVIRIPHCSDGDCADAVKKETADLCKTENMDPRAPSMGAKGKDSQSFEIPADKSASTLYSLRAKGTSRRYNLHTS